MRIPSRGRAPERIRPEGAGARPGAFRMDGKTAGKLPFSAAILAGGRSRRMGRNKALLEIDGVSLIRRAAGVLEGMFSEVFVVAGDSAPYEGMGFRVASDICPGNDSLGGLHAAVSMARGSRVFTAGCDMPLLRPALISAMASMADGWDVVVPVRSGRPEPLCAFYGKKCEAPIRESISGGDLKMTGFHPKVRVRRIEEAEWRQWDPEGASFLNANTPDEFDRIKAMITAGEGR